MKVSWSEGVGHHQQYYKQERTLIEQDWHFLQATDSSHKKTYTLAAGHHRWDFEVELPGNLPQSLDAVGGKVIYRLKATVERPAFVHNMVKKRPIRIVRCLLPSDYELVQTLEIHNTWADKMIYDILLPSKVYAYGETIPVSFNIAPLASQLRVRSVVAVLKEYCTYNTKTHSKTDTRIVRLEQKDKPFTSPPPTDTGKWTYVLKLEVPQHPPLVFCNAENDMIRIKHKLKFVISLVNADGHFSELRCAVPVVIIDSFAQQSELNMLPSYDQTWRSVPYEQAALDVLATSPSQSGAGLALTENREPITISGRTRSVSISSTTSPRVDGSREEDPNLWWHGMNLSRVPSYGTAMQNEPAPFSSSLPAYDQLSMSPHRTR